jgi:hypothetical protein
MFNLGGGVGEMKNNQLMMNFYDNEYQPLRNQGLTDVEISRKFPKKKLLEIHNTELAVDVSKYTRDRILLSIIRYVETIRRARSLKCW